MMPSVDTICTDELTSFARSLIGSASAIRPIPESKNAKELSELTSPCNGNVIVSLANSKLGPLQFVYEAD